MELGVLLMNSEDGKKLFHDKFDTDFQRIIDSEKQKNNEENKNKSNF